MFYALGAWGSSRLLTTTTIINLLIMRVKCSLNFIEFLFILRAI